MLNRLKTFLKNKSQSKYSQFVLSIISFIESIFFPLPPDLLLIPICYYNRNKIFFSVINCTFFSVLGGLVAYALGYFLYDTINHLFDQSKIQHFINFYNKWGVYSVIIGGFTPIPFKIITVTSGFLKFDLLLFLISSFFARGLRFLLIGIAIHLLGDRGIILLKKYKFSIFLVIPILLVMMVIIVKYFLN